MKKCWLRIVCISLGAVLLLWVLVCCSIHMYINPDNYTVVDYNLVWTECDREIKSTFLSGYSYYKIKDIPFHEYVACTYRPFGKGIIPVPLVAKRNDFEGTLSFDTSAAMLCIADGLGDFEGDEWLALRENMVKKEIRRVDPAITEQIARCITEGEDYVLYGYFEKDERPQYLFCEGTYDWLMLQIPIREYDSLIWVADIMKAGDRYVLSVYSEKEHRGHKYLICSDEFAALIHEIVVEHGLSPTR